MQLALTSLCHNPVHAGIVTFDETEGLTFTPDDKPIFSERPIKFFTGSFREYERQLNLPHLYTEPHTGIDLLNRAENPWYLNSGAQTAALALANEFASDLNGPGGFQILEAFNQTQQNNGHFFAFVYKLPNNLADGHPKAVYVYTYNTAVQAVLLDDEVTLHPDSYHASGNQLQYAYIDKIINSQQAVPEPSTAIAMGLLGVVGFAGNRRRRQVSAA